MAVAVLVYLILELAAISAVSWAIGFWWTLLALLLGALLGSWLARREGRRAFTALATATRAGGSGHAELTDGVLIAVGGVAIMLPGFLSDLIGFAFLLPPTRALLRKYWLARMERRAPAMRTARMRGNGTVVDGEVVDEPAEGSDRADPPAGGHTVIELPPNPSSGS